MYRRQRMMLDLFRSYPGGWGCLLDLSRHDLFSYSVPQTWHHCYWFGRSDIALPGSGSSLYIIIGSHGRRECESHRDTTQPGRGTGTAIPTWTFAGRLAFVNANVTETPACGLRYRKSWNDINADPAKYIHIIRIWSFYIDFRDAPAAPNVYRWFKICRKSQQFTKRTVCCNARIWGVQRLYRQRCGTCCRSNARAGQVNLRYETGGGARNDIHIDWHDTWHLTPQFIGIEIDVLFPHDDCFVVLTVSRDHMATPCTSGAYR